MQLTADQQVTLTVSGTDRYGNPTTITGDSVWKSSDESIVAVFPAEDNASALAVAVGPIGTAAVTFTNDVDSDGTGDFIGSLAIDVVGGEMAEIVFDAGEPENKPNVDNSLPDDGSSGLRPDQTLPGDLPHPDNSLPEEPTEPESRRR